MDVLKELQERLKEEQWTRSTIDNFKDVGGLQKIVERVIAEGKEREAHSFCLEFTKNSSKNITGLFVLGALSYHLKDMKNADALVELVEIFKENKKWPVVEELLNIILNYDPANIYALKLRLSYYENVLKGKEEEKIKTLINLVKADLENGDAAKRLAEYYESQNNEEQAKKYFKTALRRYAKQKQYSLLETLWKKFITKHFSELNFFQNITEIVSTHNPELSIVLLSELLDRLESEIRLDEAIFVAKNILENDKNNMKIRNKLVELYRAKYSSNQQLEECIKNSGLLDPKIKVDNAIRKFEKEILFDTGCYIYHKTWGIGKIAKITGDDFYLDFDDKQEHKMSYAMALKSLLPLSPDHIWVLKKEKKIKDFAPNKNSDKNQEKSKKKSGIGEEKENEDIEKLRKENTRKILLSVLKSFPDKELSIDNFKEELVPDVIDPKNWNNWWNEAKNILKEERTVGTVKEGRPRYFLRKIEIGFKEELINNFNESKKFEDRVKIFEELVKEINEEQVEEIADQLKEMVNYFKNVLQNPKFDFSEKIIAFILLTKTENKMIYKPIVQHIPVNFEDFLQEKDFVQKLLQVFSLGYKTEYKKEIINLVLDKAPEPEKILQQILLSDHGQLTSYILEKLEKKLNSQLLRELSEEVIHNRFKQNPFLTLWFIQYIIVSKKYSDYGMELKDLYIEMLYRLDQLGKLMNQKKLNYFTPPIMPSDAKVILKSFSEFLYKPKSEKTSKNKEENQHFLHFILSCGDESYIAKIYQLIKTSAGLEHKTELVKAILKKYPHIDSSKEEIIYTTIDYLDDKVIWTSQEGLERQRKLIQELNMEKERNTVEIDLARQKGDLRENAEYQAAREKERHLNNQIMQLQSLLDKARVIDFTGVSGEEVTLGTKVTIERNGNRESYTILGYWDTDEKNHILAYNSPLASAILGAKVGEERSAEIGGQKIKIKILAIEPYKK